MYLEKNQNISCTIGERKNLLFCQELSRRGIKAEDANYIMMYMYWLVFLPESVKNVSPSNYECKNITSSGLLKLWKSRFKDLFCVIKPNTWFVRFIPLENLRFLSVGINLTMNQDFKTTKTCDTCTHFSAAPLHNKRPYEHRRGQISIAST